MKLTGCYPNPFNSSTRIDFELSSQSNISLDIYDICGRRVTNLAKGDYGPGKYAVYWDAAEFVSGVYFIRLADDASSVTKIATYLK
jgi:hypothetical protein